MFSLPVDNASGWYRTLRGYDRWNGCRGVV